MKNQFDKHYLACLRADLRESIEYDRMLGKLNPIGEYAWAMNPELKRDRINLRKTLRSEIKKLTKKV